MRILEMKITGKERLPSYQRQIIEQARFTNSPLGIPFENQTKTIEEQRKKQMRFSGFN